MKKHILLLLVMVLGVGSLSVVLNAAELQYGYTNYNFNDAEAEEREVILAKGWNLVHGFANPEWIVGGGIKLKNIKAIYFLDPVTKQYVRMYPDPIRESVDNLASVTEMVALVYSKKSGVMRFKTQKSDVLRFTWPAGLNLVGVNNSIVGKSVNQIKGDCAISDYYVLQTESNDWGRGSLTLDTILDKEWFGKGLMLKFAKSCNLGDLSLKEI